MDVMSKSLTLQYKSSLPAQHIQIGLHHYGLLNAHPVTVPYLSWICLTLLAIQRTESLDASPCHGYIVAHEQPLSSQLENLWLIFN